MKRIKNIVDRINKRMDKIHPYDIPDWNVPLRVTWWLWWALLATPIDPPPGNGCMGDSFQAYIRAGAIISPILVPTIWMLMQLD